MGCTDDASSLLGPVDSNLLTGRSPKTNIAARPRSPQEGVDPATSHHVQARRSYGPENIRYGHRFARIVTVRRRSIGPNLPNFPRIRAASMHLNFANFDTTVDEDGVLFPPPSPKALPDSTDTRMRSALVRGASRMSPLSAQGMGGRGEGAGSGGGSAEEQLRVQHYELRLEGGDERRLQALWELMRMAQDPMTHATRPTLVLCRLKPDVDTVVRCLR